MTGYQVWTYEMSDEAGQTVGAVSSFFPEDDQSGAHSWATKYVESFPNDYALILKIKVGRYRGGSNMVIWDSRQPSGPVVD